MYIHIKYCISMHIFVINISLLIHLKTAKVGFEINTTWSGNQDYGSKNQHANEIYWEKNKEKQFSFLPLPIK